MPYFNRVMLMGNLTREPEIQYTSKGAPVVRFALAVNRKTTTGDGEKKDEVDFFDCEAWNTLAEHCNAYLSKGSPVFIEGQLKQERWKTDDGQQRSRIKVNVIHIQFLNITISGRNETGRNEKGNPENPGSQNPPF